MGRIRHAGPTSGAGFTLIEMMVVVTIVAILAAIAYPMYGDYVIRSRIIDGVTKLGDFRTQMEKFFMDNRTYLAGGACGVPNPALAANDSFQITCAAAAGPPETYLITASGVAAKAMAGFAFTVNQANAKTSSGPGGNYTNAGCWAVRKDGSC
jgi:prepilin-type N-terminal cleavage/methylation domain-containing protein